MIAINLVPLEMKNKQKKQLLGGVKIPIEVVIGSAGGLLFLLIMVHVALLFINVTKLKQHKALEQEWAAIAPQKQQADAVLGNMRKLNGKYTALAEITGGETIYWSPKLNAISNHVPRGVWLSKIALTEEMFFIEGSAIARQQNEMISVHRFMSNLKKEKMFIEQLTELGLESIQGRAQDKIDVADFLIKSKLKLVQVAEEEGAEE